LKTLEEVFRKPVDVEWALEGDVEYILQARPVTSYVQLPPSVVTPPGQPRKLYWDVALSVQAFEKPMSIMATSVLRRLLSEWPKKFLGIEFAGADLNHSIVVPTDGRLYAILSHVMSVFGKEKVTNLLTIMDPLSARALEEVESDMYADHQLWLKFLPSKAAPNVLKLMPKVLYARTFPEKAHERTQLEIARFKKVVRKEAQSRGSIYQIASRVTDRSVSVMANYIMPGLAASRWSLERMKKCAAGADPEYIKNLELAMPNNITIEMGLALYDLAQQLPPDDGSNNDIQNQTLSPEFMERWQTFIEKFGHRGPQELDIKSPRNRDEATLLFDQVRTLQKSSNKDNNPVARYEKNKQVRNEAYREICN
jgi:rifampicin phosphotransferase